MIDTNDLNSLSIEELRTGISLQRKEIDRLRKEVNLLICGDCHSKCSEPQIGLFDSRYPDEEPCIMCELKRLLKEHDQLLADRIADSKVIGEQRERIATLERQLASRGGVPESLAEAVRCAISDLAELRLIVWGGVSGQPYSELAQIENGLRCALADAAPSPEGQEAESAEKLGERCIDGGKCNHACADLCFRREWCVPFSDYQGPWAYPSSTPVKGQAGEREAGSLIDQSYKLAARLWHQWSKGNRGYFVNYAAAAIYKLVDDALAAQQQQEGRDDE